MIGRRPTAFRAGGGGGFRAGALNVAAIAAIVFALAGLEPGRALGGIETCPWDCEDAPSGEVGVADMLALLGQWGGAGPCDVDGGGVGVTDFLALLGRWGACPCGPGEPFLSRDDAIAVVLDQVIAGHPDEPVLVAYSLPVPLAPGATVRPRTIEDGPEMTVSACSWLFYLDLAPYEKFAHPTQFILVSGAAAAATVEITDQSWWPSIDGQEVFDDADSNEQSPDRFFGAIPGLAPGCPNACISPDPLKNDKVLEGPATPKLWGIRARGPNVYIRDTDIMKKAFKDRAGIQDDNNKLWQFDAGSLAAAVTQANDANASCVYVYISCHVTKGTKKLVTKKGEDMSAQQLAGILDDLKACSVFVILDGCTLGQNYTGKVLDALVNRAGPLNAHDPPTLGVFTSSSRQKCANMHGGACAGSDWTQALIKCWGDTAADQDGSGSVSVFEAFDWVLTHGCERARRADPESLGLSLLNCGQAP
jgi:hypothetical protein